MCIFREDRKAIEIQDRYLSQTFTYMFKSISKLNITVTTIVSLEFGKFQSTSYSPELR